MAETLVITPHLALLLTPGTKPCKCSSRKILCDRETLLKSKVNLSADGDLLSYTLALLDVFFISLCGFAATSEMTAL